MSLQDRLGALITAIGADIKALLTDGVGGQNLLPELTSVPWSTGGSGVIGEWMKSSPVRFIAEESMQQRYTVKLTSNAAVGSVVMLQLNPAARYLWLRPNKTYTWAMAVRSEDFSRDFRLRSLFFREDGTVQIATPGGEYTTLKASVVDDWIILTRTLTTPAPNAGEEWVRFKPFLYCNNLADTDVHYATEPIMVEGKAVPNYSPRPGDVLWGVDTPNNSAASGGVGRSIPAFGYHAMLSSSGRWDFATNLDPTINRLIDNTKPSFALRLVSGGLNPRVVIAYAPPAAGTPAYVEVATVGPTGLLSTLGGIGGEAGAGQFLNYRFLRLMTTGGANRTAIIWGRDDVNTIHRTYLTTNYDPAADRLINTGLPGWMLRIGADTDNVSIFRAPPTGAAPVFAEVFQVNQYGIKPPTYTVATRPAAATAGAGTQIYVSDAAAGAKMQYSDGANWQNLG